MFSIKQDERGMGHLEVVMVVAVAAIIGFVGWYVYHTKQASDRALNTASNSNTSAQPHFQKNKNITPSAASTSNASLQSDLQAASSSANQSSKDMSATNSSLGDQSTLTSVPQ